MSEAKKRAFTLELTDEDTRAFIEKCFLDGTSPAEVLEGFICDLIDGTKTRGSDERRIAGEYYTRCGYGYLPGYVSFPGEHRNFTQWLIREGTLEDLLETLDDIRAFDEEITFIKEHPGQADASELEDLEAELKDSKEQLEDLYTEYTRNTINPDTLEEGLKGVRDYLANIKNFMEGGVI